MSSSEGLTEAEVYAAAVGLLARREHSVLELVRKLGAKGAAPGVIESAIQRLIDERLQSDERYTEAYLRQRYEKGYGPLRITAELRERGIADALISAELRRAESEGEVDWFERAAAVYARKYAGRQMDDLKERAKRMRFLQYRGFSHEQVAVALDAVCNDE